MFLGFLFEVIQHILKCYKVDPESWLTSPEKSRKVVTTGINFVIIYAYALQGVLIFLLEVNNITSFII